MKKLFTLIAATGLLALSSCTSTTSTEATDNQTDDEAVEATVEQTEEGVIDLQPGETPEVGDLPVVIDCWATWCGPCMQFKPIYHKVAEEYAGKAIFMAADIDACTDMPEKYNFQAIPTVIILRKDKEPVMTTGAMTEADFKAMLDAAL